MCLQKIFYNSKEVVFEINCIHVLFIIGGAVRTIYKNIMLQNNWRIIGHDHSKHGTVRNSFSLFSNVSIFFPLSSSNASSFLSIDFSADEAF